MLVSSNSLSAHSKYAPVVHINHEYGAIVIPKISANNDEKVARKLLKARLKQVERPGFVGSKEEKWTVADMLEVIRLDYVRKGNRSFDDVQHAFKHLEAEDAFKYYRVIDITSEKIAEYGDKRLEAKAARARSTTSLLVCGAASN